MRRVNRAMHLLSHAIIKPLKDQCILCSPLLVVPSQIWCRIGFDTEIRTYKLFSPHPNIYSSAWRPNSARFFTLGFPIYPLQWDWSLHPLDRLRNPELGGRSSRDAITGKLKCLCRPRMSPMAKTPRGAPYATAGSFLPPEPTSLTIPSRVLPVV